MLELQSVKCGYGSKRVLHGVSLKVPRLQIAGLVGPNGSGKSTVLNSIFGLLKIEEGSIRYNGIRIENRKPFLNVSDGICYIPQGRKIFDKLTVQENLELGGITLRNRRELERRLAAMYELFPAIARHRHDLASKISGGERQMVGFCRGLIMRPKLVLIDEPSIGLAPSLVKQTMRIIMQIRDNLQTTILIVEQNVRDLLTIAGHVYLLSLGRIIYEEEPVVSGTEGRLRELFLK